MLKKKFLIIFLIYINTIFCQDSTQTLSKIDSIYFYTETSGYYKKNRVYDKALENANKAIIYAKKTKNNVDLANSYYNIAIIYIDLKKYDTAIEILLRSISILNTLELNSKLGLAYYNIGICYMQKENFGKADSYFEKANSVYDLLGLSSVKNMISLQKGLLFLEKNQKNIAEAIFLEVARLPKTEKKYDLQPEALYQLGQMKIKAGMNNMALTHLNKAYEMSITNKDISLQIKITKKLSEAYEKLGLSNNSLAFLKKYSQLQDSLNNIEKNKTISLVNERVKIDEIMRSMEKLDKEKKEQEKSTKFSKLINIMSIALITILSLLSLSLYKNNIIRNKSNELLREKNNELEIAKERIEKASKARAEFLSTVSHELRTPLNAINGISHILLEENPRADQIDYLKSLKFSGSYLLTYINDILEINRVESNNIEVENINFNIRELLKNIHNSLKEIASRNNNEFNLSIENNVPDILIGDPTKISQIFINLINNALKFTENGHVSVFIKVKSIENDTSSLIFEVIDSGIGIPIDKQEQIFESFSQGSVEINRKYGGTGLGLTIVKKLVNLMGGNIWVTSEPKKGSTFTFTLDLKIGNELIKENNYEIIDNNIFIDKKVLLVEDNKINQMITKKILEKKKMIVELCENGEDSIKMMANNKYDIVLMDVHLPGINGTIATEEIRKFNKVTPIIALTAISLNENREMLMSYGMTDVITKPFNPDNFYKIIETNLLEKISTA